MSTLIHAIMALFQPLTDFLNGFSGILFEESSAYSAIFVTFLLGGWAAWMAGKACAKTWRPVSTGILYLLMVALATRYIHFALFDVTLMSGRYFLFDLIAVEIIGLIGFRLTRNEQMVRQYGWRYAQGGAMK
jgi:hypothetical protein